MPSNNSKKTATTRRVAATKRISLEGLFDGWGDDCYVIVQPAGYDELDQWRKMKTDKLTEDDASDYMINLVIDKFVKGRIMLLDEKGNMELGDMEAEDVKVSVNVVTKIFAEIAGVQYDPKASAPTAPSQEQPKLNTPPSTEPTDAS